MGIYRPAQKLGNYSDSPLAVPAVWCHWGPGPYGAVNRSCVVHMLAVADLLFPASLCGLLKVPPDSLGWPSSCGVRPWPAAPWTPPVCPDVRNRTTYTVCTTPKISGSPQSCSLGIAKPARHEEVCDMQKSFKASHSALLVSAEITSY